MWAKEWGGGGAEEENERKTEAEVVGYMMWVFVG